MARPPARSGTTSTDAAPSDSARVRSVASGKFAASQPPMSVMRCASVSCAARPALISDVSDSTSNGMRDTKAEVISWFRIQEMFRFQGFHMFGVFATALPVAIVTVQLLKRLRARTLGGQPIEIAAKRMGTGARYILGGIVFGVGWSLTGACPGPLYALLGSGVLTMGAALLSALLGAWIYGWLRSNLPH